MLAQFFVTKSKTTSWSRHVGTGSVNYILTKGADYAHCITNSNGTSSFFDLPPQPGDTKLDQTIFEGEFMHVYKFDDIFWR